MKTGIIGMIALTKYISNFQIQTDYLFRVKIELTVIFNEQIYYAKARECHPDGCLTIWWTGKWSGGLFLCHLNRNILLKLWNFDRIDTFQLVNHVYQKSSSMGISYLYCLNDNQCIFVMYLCGRCFVLITHVLHMIRGGNECKFIANTEYHQLWQ